MEAMSDWEIPDIDEEESVSVDCTECGARVEDLPVECYEDYLETAFQMKEKHPEWEVYHKILFCTSKCRQAFLKKHHMTREELPLPRGPRQVLFFANEIRTTWRGPKEDERDD